jgi:glutamate synthase (NADPH/NADH) small chain
MSRPGAFKRIPRQSAPQRPVAERLRDFREIERPLSEEQLRAQASRCMDCGLPFCHGPHGCPLGNRVPEWNQRASEGRWSEAATSLLATDNFPELTCRVCPAPCESACVLGINDQPVTIRQLEGSIIERAFAGGLVKPRVPPRRTGKRVAVSGSGPAGLAVADQLNQAGHLVIVLERADRAGGLLTFGIPDFKLEKTVVERRLRLLEAEGVSFRTGVAVGAGVSLEELRQDFDAVCLCHGAGQARELAVPGRELRGVHLAMDFLTQQNRRVAGLAIAGEPILATGKQVVVVGGGDTGSDCVGTANRQGARSVTQLEILPRPPLRRSPNTPWPCWPVVLRTSSSHAEGCQRLFAVSTLRFLGAEGRLTGLETVEVEWQAPGRGGQPGPRPVPGTERTIEAELALLALGFTGIERAGLPEALVLDGRGNLETNERFMTSLPGVFAAGDARRGQSLVVWAVAEGRRAARAIDVFLMGDSLLPD